MRFPAERLNGAIAVARAKQIHVFEPTALGQTGDVAVGKTRSPACPESP